MAAQYTEDISRCEEQLRKLLAKERERDTIASLQARSHKKTEIDQLLADALPGSETPGDLLGYITINLGIDPKISAKVEIALKEYNIAVCRLVGSQLRAKLPRELRDIIYGCLRPSNVYLCAESYCRSTPLHVHNYYDDSSGPKPYMSPSPRTDVDLTCPQHYWQDKVIGVEVARELIETFYSTSTFHIATTIDTGTSPRIVLSDLLAKDRFGLGFSPAASISHIKVDLNIQESFDWLVPTSYEWGIRSWLKCLHMLRKNARIDILIYLPGELWLEDAYDEMGATGIDQGIEKVLPHLVSLRRAGYRVSLEFGPEYQDGAVEDCARWLELFEQEASKGGLQLTAE